MFSVEIRPFEDMTDYLDFVSNKWNQALGRLKSFVEEL